MGAARRFLQAKLSDWENDEYEYAAALVLTELATNATLHARTPYTVLLRLEPTHLVVEVLDSSPRLPQARHYAADSATGRGINLVDAFSNAMGCDADSRREGRVGTRSPRRSSRLRLRGPHGTHDADAPGPSPFPGTRGESSVDQPGGP